MEAGLDRFASTELKQITLRHEGRRNQQLAQEVEILEFGPVGGIAASFPD
ncbi:MAG: hypothetical protein KME19_03030 [Microcoleus vaginatus WJT46-NPBG5]|jgi:hypothetical protein|nr:hypothetical protein [Microcoleus vaginatus WJT46-NPBG5]